MQAELEDSFAEMAAVQLPGLRRFAYALCGDWDRADDLVQGTFERLYVAWPRVHAVADPGAYARTVLVRLASSEARRAWWRRERVVERLPEAAVTDHASVSAERLDLAEALAGLTLRQRAIVVLRFLEDRSVAEVAGVLGISAGTVKRQSHDAMAHLRRRLLGAPSPAGRWDEGTG